MAQDHGRGGDYRPTDEFFTRLAEQADVPLLRRTDGTLRFDLSEDDHLEHWLVEVDDGVVTVSRRNRKADVVVRVDKAMFDEMVSGRRNAMAATLRGDLIPDGDLGLLLRFQRLFPGPTTGTGRKARRPQVSASSGAAS
jgi:hypothetical protein